MRRRGFTDNDAEQVERFARRLFFAKPAEASGGDDCGHAMTENPAFRAACDEYLAEVGDGD